MNLFNKIRDMYVSPEKGFLVDACCFFISGSLDTHCPPHTYT